MNEAFIVARQVLKADTMKSLILAKTMTVVMLMVPAAYAAGRGAPLPVKEVRIEAVKHPGAMSVGRRTSIALGKKVTHEDGATSRAFGIVRAPNEAGKGGFALATVHHTSADATERKTITMQGHGPRGEESHARLTTVERSSRAGGADRSKTKTVETSSRTATDHVSETRVTASNASIDAAGNTVHTTSRDTTTVAGTTAPKESYLAATRTTHHEGSVTRRENHADDQPSSVPWQRTLTSETTTSRKQIGNPNRILENVHKETRLQREGHGADAVTTEKISRTVDPSPNAVTTVTSRHEIEHTASNGTVTRETRPFSSVTQITRASR